MTSLTLSLSRETIPQRAWKIYMVKGEKMHLIERLTPMENMTLDVMMIEDKDKHPFQHSFRCEREKIDIKGRLIFMYILYSIKQQ